MYDLRSHRHTHARTHVHTQPKSEHVKTEMHSVTFLCHESYRFVKNASPLIPVLYITQSVT